MQKSLNERYVSGYFTRFTYNRESYLSMALILREVS